MKVQRRNKLAQLLVQIQLSLVSSPWVNTKTEHLDVFELERGDPESIRSNSMSRAFREIRHDLSKPAVRYSPTTIRPVSRAYAEKA